VNATDVSIAAVVLAGGHSVRMGSDKAALPHPQSGVPLIRHQLDLLRGLKPAQLLVSARFEQTLPALPSDVARVNDDGQAGPLGGLCAAFNAVSTTHLLVVAVDLPDLTLAPLRRLLDSVALGLGAVAATGTGLEPLIAVYPREIYPYFATALAAQHLGLRLLLQTPKIQAQVKTITFDPPPPAFHNWNTPL